MNRRSFLAGTGFAAASGLATAAESLALPNYNSRESAAGPNGPAITPDSKHEKGLRLSITWSMLGQMPVPDTLALLTRLGFHGYEMFDWRDPKLLDTFLQVKDKYPLTCECLVGNKGVIAPRCGPLNPREREEFVRQMSLATEAARKVGTTQLVTLTGNELGGMPRSEQMTNAVAALREIAPMLEKNGVTAIVEILNTYVDHSGYFLYYVRDGAELIVRVGSPNVKLLFDIYHVQIMEGNLIENIRNNIDRIGHFHIGDVPGRHEPGTGEINYRNVFKAIYELGDRFQGSAALEYGPLAPLEQDLADMRKMTNFA